MSKTDRFERLGPALRMLASSVDIHGFVTSRYVNEKTSSPKMPTALLGSFDYTKRTALWNGLFE